MVAVFTFAITLLLAVLISELAGRSVLSTAVLFLFAGFVAGEGMLGLVPLHPDNPVVAQLAELALFSVLFTDGMRVGVRDLLSAWRLPGRALLLGMPLTFVGTAVLAHFVAGLPWPEAFLIGAVLSPTDPVFAAAIVGRKEIPQRLRHLLNVESGLNDGLALPLVVALLAFIGHREVEPFTMAGELALGVVLGVAVPWIASRIEQSKVFSVSAPYEPLFAFAIGLLVLSAAAITHANEYLAAFAAGVTIASIRTDLRDEFHKFGELVAELLKLAALLVFGALISPRFLHEIHWSGYVFALLALFLVRPIALNLALLGSTLGWRERVTAAWFGPKGFASVVYGMLILEAGIATADTLFHLVAIVIAASIIAHSSTDVAIARWFEQAEPESTKPSATVS